MLWTVEFEAAALKELDRLDPQDARRILNFLSEKIGGGNDPRSVGEPLRGSRFAGLWRYRVGNFRIVCQIQEEALNVLVVRIGHRREVYR